MYIRVGAASLDVVRKLNGSDDGGQVANIARRDGAPLAWFDFCAESYVWCGPRPLNLFSWRPAVTGQWELAGLRVTADRLR